MKILIYGDPHVNKYPQGLVQERRDTELKMFEDIYDRIVPMTGADMCICLGDFLHNSYVPASDMNYIANIIDRMIGVDTIILTGNHDRSDRENTALRWFPMMNSNIKVVDKYVHCNVEGKVHTLVSHGYLKDVDINILKETDYLYTHEDYPGSVVNSVGVKINSGYQFDNEDIKNGLIVFNGHIHHEGKCPATCLEMSIINVGAVSPIAFGELDTFNVPNAYILDTEENTVQQIPISTPLLPVTCTVNQYPMVKSFYKDSIDHVRLRVTYEGDIPQLDETDKFLSVEYKKLLSGSMEDASDLTTEVEDITVSVPQYIDEYVSKDKNLSDDEKSHVKGLCNTILSKI